MRSKSGLFASFSAFLPKKMVSFLLIVGVSVMVTVSLFAVKYTTNTQSRASVAIPPGACTIRGTIRANGNPSPFTVQNGTPVTYTIVANCGYQDHFSISCYLAESPYHSWLVAASTPFDKVPVTSGAQLYTTRPFDTSYYTSHGLSTGHIGCYVQDASTYIKADSILATFTVAKSQYQDPGTYYNQCAQSSGCVRNYPKGDLIQVHHVGNTYTCTHDGGYSAQYCSFWSSKPHGQFASCGGNGSGVCTDVPTCPRGQSIGTSFVGNQAANASICGKVATLWGIPADHRNVQCCQ